MKLNATSEMIPVTWPEFGNMHPFQPLDQARGYAELTASLSADLAEVRNFDWNLGKFDGYFARFWHI